MYENTLILLEMYEYTEVLRYEMSLPVISTAKENKWDKYLKTLIIVKSWWYMGYFTILSTFLCVFKIFHNLKSFLEWLLGPTELAGRRKGEGEGGRK